MKIGDRIYVRGYIDEICKDTVIVRNDGGYFGTIPSEVITGELPSAQPEIIRCKDCTHYHTDVFGGELGLTGIWENIIVAHNACDKWTKDMNCVDPDGFCFLAERRTDD